MQFTQLTDEQRIDFESNGFLVIRNALSQQKVQRLIEAGDRLIDSDRTDDRCTNNANYDSFRNVVAKDPEFLELLMWDKTVPLVAQLMSYNLQLLTSHYIQKEIDGPEIADTCRNPGWHRDIAMTPHDLGHADIPRLDIKIAYYLTDLSQKNSGITLFAPGSHLLKEPLHIDPETNDPENVVELSVNPGDAVIFENRTWHAGGLNRVGRRKCVMLGYSYQWMRPTDYVEMPDEILDQVDDIGKQLLGGLKDPEGRYVIGGILEPLRKWAEEHKVVPAWQERERLMQTV